MSAFALLSRSALGILQSPRALLQLWPVSCTFAVLIGRHFAHIKHIKHKTQQVQNPRSNTTRFVLLQLCACPLAVCGLSGALGVT